MTLVLLAVPAGARAQQPDAALLARADSITVGAYCRVTQRVLGTPGVAAALADDSTYVRLGAATICDPLLASFSLRALSGRGPAPIAAVARVRTDGYSAARRGIFDAMSEVRASLLAPDIRERVRGAVGPETFAEFSRASTTAQSLLTAGARDAALVRLARYERKLGPTSARLNGPEVLLNYAAQRWIPGFRATPLRGPSPWELVASYVPGYVTSVDREPVAVSASEFGIRRYLFGERFGAAGFAGIVRPTYWSAGVITASNRNGALVWPWEGRDRSGGYFSWGDIKVGYISGRQGEWLLSKQFQAVPFVF